MIESQITHNNSGLEMVRAMTELTVAEEKNNPLPEAIEKVLLTGDLTPLKPEERVLYYHKVCESVGLNPYTNPFAYIVMNGKLTLYAKKEASDQIRNNRKISVQIVARERLPGDLYVVTARASDPTGRFDESTGVVHFARLQGELLANAYMKAETKAKRRVTLSFSGLSMVDETEIESIKGAVKVDYDYVPPPLSVSDSSAAEIFYKNSDVKLRLLHEKLSLAKVPGGLWDSIEDIMQGMAITKQNLQDAIKMSMQEKPPISKPADDDIPF